MSHKKEAGKQWEDNGDAACVDCGDEAPVNSLGRCARCEQKRRNEAQHIVKLPAEKK